MIHSGAASYSVDCVGWIGVYEGLGATCVDRGLLERKDVGLHGQSWHHAYRCLAIQVSSMQSFF
jgi:hypothetical protein